MPAMMKIYELLSREAIEVDLSAGDKDGLLRELSRKAARSLQIPEKDVLKAILSREELGSTGTGGGIALPHARMAAVPRPFAVFARLRRPIDFEAVDGAPVDLVCLVLLPPAKGDQINALACVARGLRDPGRLKLIREAPDAATIYAALIQDSPAA